MNAATKPKRFTAMDLKTATAVAPGEEVDAMQRYLTDDACEMVWDIIPSEQRPMFIFGFMLGVEAQRLFPKP